MTSNHWLEEEVTYEGRGRAEFSDPAVIIEGPAKVIFSTVIDSSCSMTIDKIKPNQQYGLFQALTGQEPIKDGETLTYPGTPKIKQCIRLTVQCEKGQFISEKVVVHNPLLAKHPNGIEFNIQEGRYDANNAGSPRYFAVPLQNVLTKFCSGGSQSFEHPLRSLQKSHWQDATDEEREILFRGCNDLIVFNMHGNQVFIDPLPDYEEKAISLKKRTFEKRATAVLIGDCLETPSDPKAILEYVPFRLLALIALGTGQTPGAPWMEARTETKELVCRLHYPLGSPFYQLNSAPVPDCLGRLITIGMAAKIEHEETWCVLAYRHAVRAGRDKPATIEERLLNCFTAFESLNKAFGFQLTNLVDYISKDKKEDILKILEDASQEIKEIRDGLPDEEDKASRALQSIGDRVKKASDKGEKFTGATEKLIAKFDLPDLELVKDMRFFREDQRKEWLGLLKHVRNKIIHEGYLEGTEAPEIAKECNAFATHLRDILVRILLKMASFDGHYQPLTMSQASYPVDFLKNELAEKGAEETAKYLNYPSNPLF